MPVPQNKRLRGQVLQSHIFAVFRNSPHCPACRGIVNIKMSAYFFECVSVLHMCIVDRPLPFFLELEISRFKNFIQRWTGGFPLGAGNFLQIAIRQGCMLLDKMFGSEIDLSFEISPGGLPGEAIENEGPVSLLRLFPVRVKLGKEPVGGQKGRGPARSGCCKRFRDRVRTGSGAHPRCCSTHRVPRGRSDRRR